MVSVFIVVVVNVIFLQFANGDWTASFNHVDKIKTVDESFRSKRGLGFGMGPTIRSLTITTNIVARFSDTVVKSEVGNFDIDAQVITFKSQLPRTAFISNFSIIIDDVEYVGEVKRKAVARALFANAQAQGLSAGLVESTQRETHWFQISLNVESFQTVTFKLRFQQLLTRRLGSYEQILFSDPGQNVDVINVDVYLTEPTGIAFLDADDPYIGTSNRSPQDKNFLKDVTKSSVQGRASYWQYNFEADATSSGRRFVVKYQVEKQDLAGDVFRHNGYFVHFFSPKKPILPKRLVFVIDLSASMRGTKLEQTKTALISLIRQLNKADKFGIVGFNVRASYWKINVTSAFEQTDIDAAISYVKSLTATGATNLFGGIVTGIQMLDRAEKSEKNVIKGTLALVVLTDGVPTLGLKNLNVFRSYLKRFNSKEYPVFCLGFGNGADHEFLKQVSTENGAVSRKIFEGFDAADQIEGFISEYANPMLAKISMTYVGNVNDLTQTTFDVYYEGSEITVMGQTDMSTNDDVEFTVVAVGFGGTEFNEGGFGGDFGSEFDYPVAENVETEFGIFFERMWAYLTIKQLLDRHLVEGNPNIKKAMEEEIISTSLKYNFVTPFTSMFASTPGVIEEVQLQEREPKFENFIPVQANKVEAEEFIPAPDIVVIQPAACFQCNVVSNKKPTVNVGKGIQSFAFKPNLFPKPMTTKTTTITTTTTTTTTTTAAPTTQDTTILPPIPSHPDDIASDPGCGFSANVNAENPVTISSPGKIYPRSTTCKWVITDFMNRQMQMQFNRFDLEDNNSCNRDRVLVFVDYETGNKQPKVFCGSDIGDVMFMSTHKIAVIFQSNNVVQGTGFEAVFK